MSIARPSQCVFCIFRRTTRHTASPKRSLQSSAIRRKRKNDDEQLVDFPVEGRRALGAHKDQLRKHYTPKQREAIEAAQSLIPKEAFDAGPNPARPDTWKVDYWDDLEKIDPVYDKPLNDAKWKNLDDTARLKEEEEIEDDFVKLIEKPPTSEEEEADFFERFDRNMRLTVGKEAHERSPPSALMPQVPTPKARPGSGGKPRQESGFIRGEQASAALVRLMQMTGYSVDEIAKLRVKTLISHRVVNQTRLGKISKQYFLSIAGNGHGLLGIGEGKSDEPTDARLQSQYRAIRNMMPILRYENRTIYGDVKAKVCATELEIMSRPPGINTLIP